MRKLEFNESVNVAQKHKNAYSGGILGVLKALSHGGVVAIRDRRNKKEVKFLNKSLGPVKGAGVDYVNLVLELFVDQDYPTEDLLTASPDHLENCASKLKSFWENLSKEERADCDAAKKVILQLFDYDKFCSGQGLKFFVDDKLGPYIEWVALADWSAWHLIRALDVDACAYCNADAVFALCINQKVPGRDVTFAQQLAEQDADGEDGTDVHTAEQHKRSPLDHFYVRSEYPCLGLSLYNLVPACTRCNTNMKGAKEQDAVHYIHPYRESFDDGIRFYALFNDYASLMMAKNEPNVSLVFRSKHCKDRTLPERAKASAEFFHLDEVYNQTYKREVVDAVRRIVAFPDSYWEDMRKRYPGIDDVVVNRMLLGCSLNRQRINKERFSKMICDLNDQLRTDCRKIAFAFARQSK